MSPPIITLTTDFGTEDSYVSQMKGVILGINPRVHLVDVTHAVPPQNVRRAAFLLDQIVDAFPEGTIHLVVVDPGVGTDRPMIAGELGRNRFVAPDNGVLSLIAERHELRRCIHLTEGRFWRHSVSNTFHGRDVMGPVAAHWSLGLDLSEFGQPLEDSLVTLGIPKPNRTADEIEGEIIHVDSFGNLITNIDEGILPREPASRKGATIELGSHRIEGIVQTYGERPVGALVALMGSSGRLEIAVNQGSAADVVQYQVATGHRVPVRVLVPD